jgi:hypothetical protein
MKKFISILLIAMTLLSLAACQSGDPATTAATGGNKEPKELVLADTYTAITANANMPEMWKVDNDLLLDLYGIQAQQCKQLEVYQCVNSLRADEIWLIEAVSADALAELKQKAEARLTAKDEESITYDPDQNAIVKKAHLATYGNYLVMIVSPDVETITAAFKTEAGV